ncbi:MAG: molybdopterin converting factor subunit 1 [Pseudomonadota bacterium]
MRIEVLYFAIVRERLKLDHETVELPGQATVGDARAAIGARHPSIASLLPRVQAAVNRSWVPDEHPLADGDELALLPPVAGGAFPGAIRMTPAPVDVAAAADAVGGGDPGAVVTFAGVVRRRGHHLDDVVRLEYEAYIEMAEAVLVEIAEEIERAWPGTRVAIHHRVGSLAVGETAVAIAVAAPHRAPAFDACRAAIDRIKERAPIWKKEIGERGEAWVGFGS